MFYGIWEEDFNQSCSLVASVYISENMKPKSDSIFTCINDSTFET